MPATPDTRALAALATIQLQQINRLLLPEKPGGFCHPAKVGRARTMIVGLVADFRKITDAAVIAIDDVDAGNILRFNRSNLSAPQQGSER